MSCQDLDSWPRIGARGKNRMGEKTGIKAARDEAWEMHLSPQNLLLVEPGCLPPPMWYKAGLFLESVTIAHERRPWPRLSAKALLRD